MWCTIVPNSHIMYFEAVMWVSLAVMWVLCTRCSVMWVLIFFHTRICVYITLGHLASCLGHLAVARVRDLYLGSGLWACKWIYIQVYSIVSPERSGHKAC